MKHVLRFLFAMTIGVFYGLFFAQKSGKKLRSELAKSDTPYQKLFQELKAVDIEAYEYVRDWAHHSDDIQHVLDYGKDHFDHVVEKVNTLSGEAKEQAQKALEDFSKKAQEAAKKINAKAVQKGKEFLKK